MGEYILTKECDDANYNGCDQSESEVFSGLTIVENTSDMLTRSATVTRPRISQNGFTFPFDASGNTNSFEIDMITAKADYYEPELFYHGSQCKAFESLTLSVEGASSSSGGSGNGGGGGGGGGSNGGGGGGGKGGGSVLFVDAMEGEQGMDSLTLSEMLFGALLLVAAAFAIDQLWRWSTSDGSKLQVSTADDDDAPLLSHA